MNLTPPRAEPRKCAPEANGDPPCRCRGPRRGGLGELKTLASMPPPVVLRRVRRPGPRRAEGIGHHRMGLRNDEGLEGASRRTVRRAPEAAAASSKAARTGATSRSSFAVSVLRTSMATSARSGTMFRAFPPLMTPTFEVILASMRPARKRAMADAAATMALIPFSGRPPHGPPSLPERNPDPLWTAPD